MSGYFRNPISAPLKDLQYQWHNLLDTIEPKDPGTKKPTPCLPERTEPSQVRPTLEIHQNLGSLLGSQWPHALAGHVCFHPHEDTFLFLGSMRRRVRQGVTAGAGVNVGLGRGPLVLTQGFRIHCLEGMSFADSQVKPAFPPESAAGCYGASFPSRSETSSACGGPCGRRRLANPEPHAVRERPGHGTGCTDF